VIVQIIWYNVSNILFCISTYYQLIGFLNTKNNVLIGTRSDLVTIPQNTDNHQIGATNAAGDADAAPEFNLSTYASVLAAITYILNKNCLQKINNINLSKNNTLYINNNIIQQNNYNYLINNIDFNYYNNILIKNEDYNEYNKLYGIVQYNDKYYWFECHQTHSL
jgi:hypothetical protein